MITESARGVRVGRKFTREGVDPLDQVKWKTFKCKIGSSTDGTVFEQDDVEAPADWSQLAVDIAASKYFRKAGLPGGAGEHSVRQLIERVAGAIALSGLRQGYFDERGSRELRDELAYLLVTQRLAFNSPVWFNVGLFESYGICGESAGNWFWGADGKPELCRDGYTHPQSSACFIQSIRDDLMDIADHVEREMRIFKYGSGSGSNFSALREAGARLSGGGKSSGVMSFLEVFDRAAGAIKSGGVTRRAAKMVILDVDHPDVEEFVDWKVGEERKAKALIAAGWPSDFNGEAYRTVGGQNANNSVRVTDAFMRAAMEGRSVELLSRVDKRVVKTLPARDLMRRIAQAAWECADPGLQYADTINSWHTCADTSEIRGCNPCVPGHTLILTRQGYRRIDGLVGQSVDVWNGARWSVVEPRVTGHDQPLVRVRLSDGTSLDCTPAHQFILADGSRVAASDLEEGEALAKFDMPLVEEGSHFPRAYEHGVYCGDGSEGQNGQLHVRLYGEKMKLAEHLSGAFIGNVVNPGEPNENRLFRLHDGLPVKWSVPLDARPEDRLAWFAGLLDSDGTVLRNPNSVMLQVSSVRPDFLRSVRLMLTTLGVRAKVTKAKDAGTSLLPDGRGGMKDYPTQELWRLLVNAEDTYRMACAGLRTRRLALPKLQPRRDARRFVTVESVNDIGQAAKVYCFTEPLNHSGTFDGIITGQCSEYLFIDDSACNLASLNLVKFQAVSSAEVVVDEFEHACRVSIVAQEILVDYASYPTAAICRNSHDYRPLGLGYANLGAMLMRAGLPYDSAEARSAAAKVTSLMSAVAWETSCQLAGYAGGPFPAFRDNASSVGKVLAKHAAADGHLGYEPSRNAWRRAQAEFVRHGVRNAQVTLLAPTGTIGLLMDCDTTGVEPEFALVKDKKLAGGGSVRIPNRSVEFALSSLGYEGEKRDEIVRHLAATSSIEGSGIADRHLPVFDTAARNGSGSRTISPSGHVMMMSAVQPFLSGAISKTVNVPEQTTVDEVERIFFDAWKLGIKSIAIYRERSKGCQVLTGAGTESANQSAPVRRELPNKRTGFTQKARVGGQKLYLRTGEYEDGTLGEIFIDVAKEGATVRSLMNVVAMAVSAGLQHGVPLDRFVDMFTFTRFEPSGPVRGHDSIRHATSLVDYIFRALGVEYLGRDDLAHVGKGSSDERPAVDASLAAADGKVCGVCGNLATRRSGTCYVCGNCGSQTGCA